MGKTRIHYMKPNVEGSNQEFRKTSTFEKITGLTEKLRLIVTYSDASLLRDYIYDTKY
jgi:hypothetical protein